MPDDYDALGPVLITNTTLVETARLLTVEHEERGGEGEERAGRHGARDDA